MSTEFSFSFAAYEHEETLLNLPERIETIFEAIERKRTKECFYLPFTFKNYGK